MVVGSDLPYLINDADNHFNEPPDCFERYIDPLKRGLAVRFVTAPDGRKLQLFAGRPSKFNGVEGRLTQITFSDAELAKMLGQPLAEQGLAQGAQAANSEEMSTLPGMLLNRLNPLKDLSDGERAALIAEFRDQTEAYGNAQLRLALMDAQGVDKAIMFPAAAHDIEYEFADDLDALHANVRAFNRWMHEEVGFVVDGRMFLPPYIALADVDAAVAELEIVLGQGAPM